ncbi:MAG: PepSY domain-containing protein [Geminicoccaceae bacterium]|nr:PepSY domain-containing protein [Geminicoccaceae bacterium]MCX8101197.1 PepSY domain-containing protein [Geminicoccaceae bacterium]MDW8368968.1 PepSY domain-containing protein [Geminicoccaceae bacterium]
MIRSFALPGAAAALTLLLAGSAGATGLVTCDSGPPAGWQPQETLQRRLVEKGWDVRRIKVDGGCYEVYAVDPQGRRVEAYFHPVSLDHLRSFTR